MWEGKSTGAKGAQPIEKLDKCPYIERVRKWWKVTYGGKHQ